MHVFEVWNTEQNAHKRGKWMHIIIIKLVDKTETQWHKLSDTNSVTQINTIKWVGGS